MVKIIISVHKYEYIPLIRPFALWVGFVNLAITVLPSIFNLELSWITEYDQKKADRERLQKIQVHYYITFTSI